LLHHTALGVVALEACLQRHYLEPPCVVVVVVVVDEDDDGISCVLGTITWTGYPGNVLLRSCVSRAEITPVSVNTF